MVSLIQKLCSSQELYFLDMTSDPGLREECIKNAVLLVVGICTAMKSYFVSLQGSHRPIFLSYHLKNGGSTDTAVQEPIGETLPSLIRGSGMIPGCSEDKTLSPIQDIATTPDPNAYFPIDFIESLYIPSTALNASKLHSLAGVRIHWTDNISRHLLLSQHAGIYYLELFTLPCMLQGGGERTLANSGIPKQYMSEIQQSYANLFNPTSSSITHEWLGRPLGVRWWCWCLSCTSERLARRELRRRKRTSKNTGNRK